MNILVCLKQILDPEIPARDFRVDTAQKEAVRGSANLVLNIFCANALETALQLRDRHGGKITALSFGAPTAEDILRKALALKVDEAILLVNDLSGKPEPLTVARVLAAGIRKLGTVDLVLVGREAGDWGWGQTGGLLAEELGWPSISFVDQVEPAPANPKAVRVRRQTDTGWETLEAVLPLVVTITNNEKNVPRIPKTRDVMQSARKPLSRWTLTDLEMNPGMLGAEAASEVVDLSIPRKETACAFVTGETLDERITALARRIREVMHSS